MIVFPYVKKGEHTTVDPSTSLFHQILMRLHGVSFGDSIGDILQIISFIRLTVNTQREDSVLSEVHIGLSVVFLLDVRIEKHFEIAVFE